MSTKTTIVANYTGTLTPDTYQFEVTDPSVFKTVVIDGLGAASATTIDRTRVQILRENRNADGWEPATNGQGQEVLSANNRTATPLKPGVYGLSGTVAGVTIYTEEV
jgi:hypothetical protein